jgi:anti-sigma regulatory factor (Ser/Thr protein kinase)
MSRLVQCDIRRTLPARLEAIEEFFLEFRAICRCLTEQSQRFTAELLIREALTNGVLHGCGADASKRVRCAVRLRSGRLMLAVWDEGEGFDWRTALACGAGEAASSGRGLEIFRLYATRVRFNRKGNGVAIWKRL